MKEIGGYIELDTYHLPMLHEDAIALNCGRNALAYLIKSKAIKKLQIPYFTCSSIPGVCERENVQVKYYHIGLDFKPLDVTLEPDEWLYLINFYGQLTNSDIRRYVALYRRVIVDQANGYYEKPLPDVDTLYTCRKWFGVADGAFLYTDKVLSENFPVDESFNRMRFLLARYERTASEFYNEYSANNEFFVTEPIKRMSKLTRNLLHGLDYTEILSRRQENYNYLHERLGGINQLSVKPAAFMYPLLIDHGKEIRRCLQKKKIYIPTLWPKVFEVTKPEDMEYTMAENILPLPVDQRYGLNDMALIVEAILHEIRLLSK